MNLLRKVILLSLAVLITLSASGVNLSLHKCCGKIKSFSFFSAADKCKMEAQPIEKCAKVHSDMVVKAKKQCCSDKQISIHKHSEAPVKNGINEFSSQSYLFVLTYIKNWLRFSIVETPSLSVFREILYSKPLTILFRQFRI